MMKGVEKTTFESTANRSRKKPSLDVNSDFNKTINLEKKGSKRKDGPL